MVEDGASAARIETVGGGPYRLTGAVAVQDHLGVLSDRQSPVEPCWCAGSATQPVCDGACERQGFSTAKDPRRVPDRRESYPGLALTVVDDRGICQHSGLCTDRLRGVFHAESEPFVTPTARLPAAMPMPSWGWSTAAGPPGGRISATAPPDEADQHAGAIATRLADGTMPCDGAWTHEKIEVFRRWVEEGTQP